MIPKSSTIPENISRDLNDLVAALRDSETIIIVIMYFLQFLCVHFIQIFMVHGYLLGKVKKSFTWIRLQIQILIIMPLKQLNLSFLCHCAHY